MRSPSPSATFSNQNNNYNNNYDYDNDDDEYKNNGASSRSKSPALQKFVNVAKKSYSATKKFIGTEIITGNGTYSVIR